MRLGELVVYYQPIFDLRSAPGTGPADLPARTPFGVEALIRWAHPTRGLLGPAEFLPYAEDNALGDAIGDQVLAQVLDQLARWRTDVPAAEPLRVAVNVTVRQLTGPRFAEHILEQLAVHDIPTSRLSLELTETQLMSDPERTIGTPPASGCPSTTSAPGSPRWPTCATCLPARSLAQDRPFVRGRAAGGHPGRGRRDRRDPPRPRARSRSVKGVDRTPAGT